MDLLPALVFAGQLLCTPAAFAMLIWIAIGAVVAESAKSALFFFVTAPCVSFAIMLCVCELFPSFQGW